MKTIKTISIALILTAVIIGLGVIAVKAQSKQTYTATVATTTPPTRLQQTQALIASLKAQRLQDSSFIAETNKQIAELKKDRDAQATIDALTIVKTQLDVEIANLNGK